MVSVTLEEESFLHGSNLVNSVSAESSSLQ